MYRLEMNLPERIFLNFRNTNFDQPLFSFGFRWNFYKSVPFTSRLISTRWNEYIKIAEFLRVPFTAAPFTLWITFTLFFYISLKNTSLVVKPIHMDLFSTKAEESLT